MSNSNRRFYSEKDKVIFVFLLHWKYFKQYENKDGGPGEGVLLQQLDDRHRICEITLPGGKKNKKLLCWKGQFKNLGIQFLKKSYRL